MTPLERPQPSPAPLLAELDSQLPRPLAVGAGTALLVAGRCEPRARALELRLGSLRRPVRAAGMPPEGRRGAGDRFWELLPIPGSLPRGEHRLELWAELEGAPARATLGVLEAADRDRALSPAPPSAPAGRGPLIAVCMATHEPEPSRLAAQLDSIRAQDWPDWLCAISDDASSPESFEALRGLVEGDPRFVVSRSEERLGFYRNFERALAMVPAEAAFVALSDQDDVWDPDKLSALHATLSEDPGRLLAFSDMRITDERGAPLSDTYWVLRRNRYDEIASLLVANTVTGAASLMRRGLLADALPFPPAIGRPYHDHWLALCALATGEIGYLDRPTYTRVRHLDSVTSGTRHAEALRRLRDGGRRGRPRARELLARARAALGGRSAYFERYLLLVQMALVLELRAGPRIAARKLRALRRMRAAERSLPAAAWLGLRSLRPLLGRNETMGRERVLFGAVLWRRLAALGAAAQRRAR